jgi:hypothetical protein
MDCGAALQNRGASEKRQMYPDEVRRGNSTCGQKSELGQRPYYTGGCLTMNRDTAAWHKEYMTLIELSTRGATFAV